MALGPSFWPGRLDKSFQRCFAQDPLFEYDELYVFFQLVGEFVEFERSLQLNENILGRGDCDVWNACFFRWSAEHDGELGADAFFAKLGAHPHLAENVSESVMERGSELWCTCFYRESKLVEAFMLSLGVPKLFKLGEGRVNGWPAFVLVDLKISGFENVFLRKAPMTQYDSINLRKIH